MSPAPLIARIENALPGRVFAYALLTLTALFWAGTIIAGRAATPEVPPLALNFWRWLVAFLAILPFTGRSLVAKRAVLIAHWRILGLLGFLNMTAFGGLFFLGLEHTQAINASILLATMTINIVLVSWLFFGVGISPIQICGVAIGFVGIMTIVVRGSPDVLAGLEIGIGDPLLWASTLTYAFYTTALPKAPKALTPSELMTVLCGVGTVTCLPLWALEAVTFARPTEWTIGAVLAIGFLAVFPSLLAQIFWVAGIARVGANTAGYFIYTVPVFGTVMAIALLGETMAWYHGLGIVLVFIGVYTATSRGGAAKPAEIQTD